MSSADMVLMALADTADNERGRTVSELVSCLGLLQPTVSMAVSSLEKAGLAGRSEPDARGIAGVRLADAGRRRARQVEEQLESLRVGHARANSPSVL